MRVETVSKPFEAQKRGASGLRARTRTFMQPGYLENFVQSIFTAIGGVEGKTLKLGGDGRFFNVEAAQTILKLAAANGASRVLVGAAACSRPPPHRRRSASAAPTATAIATWSSAGTATSRPRSAWRCWRRTPGLRRATRKV